MAFKRVAKALRPTARSGAGIVALHDTQLDEAPKGLLDGTTGLAAIQPIRRPDGKLSFIAFWSSPEDASFSGPVLDKRLGTTVLPAVSGVAGELITKPPSGPWAWVKDKAVPLLLGTVAVLTAGDALLNRYNGLIAKPQFTVRFDAPVYSADQGDSVAATLTVENALTGVELSRINVQPELRTKAGSGRAGALQMLQLQDVSLPATKARTYHLSLESLTPGEHILTSKVTAKAGLFRDDGSSAANARVIVWPALPEASVAFKHARQNRADFIFTLRVGKIPAQSGVVCALDFKDGISAPANPWRPLGKASDGTWHTIGQSGQLEVSWAAVSPRSLNHAEFSVLGPPNTDWNELAPTLQPKCSVI